MGKARTLIIKYGGSITKDKEATDTFIEDIAALRAASIRMVVVHGGGPEINRLLDRLNLKGEFIKGLRITDEAVMEAVEMALSGRVNKSLAARLVSKGVAAIGISGRDGGLLEASKLYLEDGGNKIDIGFVGEVTGVNGKLISDLLELGYTPVISPVAGDKEGNVYNINADYAAAAIGVSLNADCLVYISDVEGLYGDFNDKSSLINSITTAEVKELIENKAVSGGMIPKMKCCIEAVEKGVKSVCLIGGQKAHALLELIEGKPVGTIIKGGTVNV